MQQYFEIPSTDLTVRKATVDGIVERVLREAGISNADCVYLDSFNTAFQPGSTIGDSTEVAYASPDKVYINVEEEREEMARINRQIGMNYQIPFFNNPNDQVSAAPILCGYDVTLTFKRVGSSRDELLRWTNRLESLMDMGRFSTMVESEAYYLIPPPALTLLEACWRASEERVKRYATFVEYLEAYFHKAVTIVANQVGEQEMYAVRWAPTRIEVVYDVAAPEWEKDENHFTASFTAKYTYHRPTEVVVAYPYIINQTALPQEWWPEIDPPWLSNEDGAERSLSQALSDGTWWINEAHHFIRVPYLMCPKEQFNRTHSPLRDKMITVFGTDIAFGPENMENPEVLSLDDLPYTWNAEILPYIEHCRAIDPTGQTGIFRIEVFEEGLVIEGRLYKWERNTLRLNRKMDVTKHYFVTESVIRDWRNFNLWPLQNYPKAAKIIIDWLFPEWLTPDHWWVGPVLPPSVVDEIEKYVGTRKPMKMLTVINTNMLVLRGV